MLIVVMLSVIRMSLTMSMNMPCHQTECCYAECRLTLCLSAIFGRIFGSKTELNLSNVKNKAAMGVRHLVE
jgi:hypothetical protein